MQTASKKVVNGWAMYDWANSVYNLVITTTFFPIYYLGVTGDGNDATKTDYIDFLWLKHIPNSSLYDYTLAVAFLFVAFHFLNTFQNGKLKPFNISFFSMCFIF